MMFVEGVLIGVVATFGIVIVELLIIGFIDKKNSLARSYLMEKHLLDDFRVWVKDQRLK